MSIWSDIHKRSNGKIVSKEDEFEMYSDEFSQMGSGEYNYFRYEIWAGNGYPLIKITPDINLTMFSEVYSVQCVMPDGKSYDLDKKKIDGFNVFYYHCNKSTDYVQGLSGHDGKRYTLNELKDLAKEFIKHLINCEMNLIYKQDFDF